MKFYARDRRIVINGAEWGDGAGEGGRGDGERRKLKGKRNAEKADPYRTVRLLVRN